MEEILDSNEENKNERKHNLAIIQLVGFINKRTEELLEEKYSKEEIFNRLIDTFGNKDEKIIAKHVAGTVSLEKKPEYSKYRNLLLFLLSISIIGTCYRYMYFFNEVSDSLFTIIFMFILIWVDISMILKVLKYRGEVLYSIMIVSVIFTTGYLFDINKGEYTGISYIFVIALIIEFIIAYSLKRKAFPNLGYRGPSKSQFGNYKF